MIFTEMQWSFRWFSVRTANSCTDAKRDRTTEKTLLCGLLIYSIRVILSAKAELCLPLSVAERPEPGGNGQCRSVHAYQTAWWWCPLPCNRKRAADGYNGDRSARESESDNVVRRKDVIDAANKCDTAAASYQQLFETHCGSGWHCYSRLSSQYL